MSDWWANIEREIDRLGAEAPDPWVLADIDESVALTEEQVAFLRQLEGAAPTLVDADDWSDDDPAAGAGP